MISPYESVEQKTTPSVKIRTKIIKFTFYKIVQISFLKRKIDFWNTDLAPLEHQG